MNDKAVCLLEQYDLEVHRTRKGRSAILCDTSRGSLIFKEYMGSTEKIVIQDKLLKQIDGMGCVRVESIIPAKDGKLLVKGNDGTSYVLKTFFEGRELNILDKDECVESVKLLARLHCCMEEASGLREELGGLSIFVPEKEYEKRNRELRKVKRYLRKKGQKTWFEISLQYTYDYFLEQAVSVAEERLSYSTSARKKAPIALCHGDYQHHNIIKFESDWCIINFEKCMADNPIRDLYLLLRKLLEKSNWSVPLGTRLLEAYDSVMPISAFSWIDLYYRLAYPEKFWKIVNFYFNTGKAWIPERNQDKLERLMAQEKEKQHFLDVVFRNISGVLESNYRR